MKQQPFHLLPILRIRNSGRAPWGPPLSAPHSIFFSSSVWPLCMDTLGFLTQQVCFPPRESKRFLKRLLKFQNVSSAALYRPKQVMVQPRFQSVEKWTPALVGRSSEVTLQRDVDLGDVIQWGPFLAICQIQMTDSDQSTGLWD